MDKQGWDPLSVTMAYEGAEIPLVRGSPYITAKVFKTSRHASLLRKTFKFSHFAKSFFLYFVAKIPEYAIFSKTNMFGKIFVSLTVLGCENCSGDIGNFCGMFLVWLILGQKTVFKKMTYKGICRVVTEVAFSTYA